jgi:hypothetical protein
VVFVLASLAPAPATEEKLQLGSRALSAWEVCELTNTHRYYVAPCKPVSQNVTAGEGFKSDDLSSEYDAQCPYFDSCGFIDNTGTCEGADEAYDFRGYLGKVVEIPANLADPNGIYKVTFNDGRTTYDFLLADLEMYEPPYNYELWFVQRTPYDFVIQQKKPFRVTGPKCT